MLATLRDGTRLTVGEILPPAIADAGYPVVGGVSTSDQRAEIRQMIEVNLLGAMTATEVFLDQLRDGGGDLVNISSVAGRTPRVGNAAYAATKWGLNGWSEGLCQGLQPDIRVTLIEPGAVATELTDHITHAEAKQGAEQLYRQLAITAEDIAEIIAFAVTRPRRLTINEILVRPTANPAERPTVRARPWPLPGASSCACGTDGCRNQQPCLASNEPDRLSRAVLAVEPSSR